MTMTRKRGRIPTSYTEDTMSAILRSVTDKIDNQRQPRRTASACYIRRKPKGLMLENIQSVEVAAPTDKRGFVVPEFERPAPAPARVVMVYGHGWGHPQGRPHGYGRVFNIHAHPRSLKTARVAFQSLVGAETMPKVVTLARHAAPTTSLARTAAPSHLQADTTDPQIISLHAAAENALASALYMLRATYGDPAKLQAATGCAIRAATAHKRLSAAQAAGRAS